MSRICSPKVQSPRTCLARYSSSRKPGWAKWAGGIRDLLDPAHHLLLTDSARSPSSVLVDGRGRNTPERLSLLVQSRGELASRSPAAVGHRLRRALAIGRPAAADRAVGCGFPRSWRSARGPCARAPRRTRGTRGFG